MLAGRHRHVGSEDRRDGGRWGPFPEDPQELPRWSALACPGLHLDVGDGGEVAAGELEGTTARREGLVDRQDLLGAGVDAERRIVEQDRLLTAAALVGRPAAGAVDQDVAHGHGGDRHEVRAGHPAPVWSTILR